MNQTAAKRLPWEDRWAQPTLEQLTQPLNEQQRKVCQRLLDGLDQFEGLHWHFAWHGRAWKWTLQFDLYDSEGQFIGPLVYIVPNPDLFEFCMPMKEATIEQVNLKRLQKFVRDGLRAAKCAVSLHWAIFHPTAATETDQLLDLVKRVHKVLRTQDNNGTRG
jgi:hypothetical protein